MSELYTTFAAIYDAAFDWDVGNEAEAIAALSGLTEGRVLEPMCGSGRLLRAFARNGFQTVGVDISKPMLALAEAHYDRHHLSGTWLHADATNFDLDEACDLAVCPINSLAHLQTEAAMLDHLSAVSRNLYDGSSYWLMLDLKEPRYVGDAEEWEFDYLGQTLLSRWACTGYHDGSETHLSSIVFPDGKVIEEAYEMKAWDYTTWSRMLAASPFELSAAYSGTSFDPLPVGESLNGERLFWQQLVKML